MTPNVPAGDKNLEILEVCFPIVDSICRKYLRRHHDIEDAIQDTFLKMITHGMNGTRPRLAGWLSTAAYTSCIDKIRREKSEIRRRLERSRMRWPDESEVLEREETCQRIEMALQHLDEYSRQLLVDRFYHETSLSAVADRIGVSISTVSRWMATAQSTLAGLIEENAELRTTNAERRQNA